MDIQRAHRGPRASRSTPTQLNDRAAGTGAVNFPLTFAGGTSSGSVTVTEIQQSGYTLQPVGGQNAVCMRADTGEAVAVTNNGELGFTAPASSLFPVTLHRLQPRSQSPRLGRGQQEVGRQRDYLPQWHTARRPAGGPQHRRQCAALGRRADRVQQGDSVVLNETFTNNLPLCTVDSRLVTSANGTVVPPASGGLPYTAVLQSGVNTFTVTNTVTCQTRLTLHKTVANGPAAAYRLGPLRNRADRSGARPRRQVPESTALVTPNARYALAESGGDPRYVQRAGPNASPIPGSTVSWLCNQIDAMAMSFPASRTA